MGPEKVVLLIECTSYRGYYLMGDAFIERHLSSLLEYFAFWHVPGGFFQNPF